MMLDRPRRSPRTVAAGLILGAGLFGVALASEAPGQQRDFVVQGEPPPEFSLQDTGGKLVRLSDFRGRVILLSFWSCYTDTCFSSLTAFDDLLERFSPKGLAAPTVCQELPPALAQDQYAGLIKRCYAGQTLLLDPEQRIGRLYHVDAFPQSFLIGPDFTLVEVIRGVAPLRDPALLRRIEELIGRQPGPAPKP